MVRLTLSLVVFMVCHAAYAERWTVIHAGTLIAEPGSPPLTRQSVIVKDDRIDRVAVGYVELDGARLVDLKDAYVLPGLIDAHVHLGLGGDHATERGPETGGDVYRLLDVVENARKTLAAGVTTVRDVGGEGWAVFAMRDAVRAGVFPGPRLFVAGHIIRIGTTEADGPGACHDVGSCRAAVRRQIAMGADWIKLYATCSGSKPCGRESAPPVFLRDEIAAVIATAGTHQIPVAAHAHGTAGINAALEAGVRSIEHGSYNDRASRALFTERGAFYVPTLAVQDNLARDYEAASEDMKPVMEGFMRDHPSRVAAAYAAGVKIAAGSDAGVTPHGGNARELWWYVKIGMSAAEALRAATVVNAELLGKQGELGVIAAGAYADIIAVRRNPLDDIAALDVVEFVMAGGHVVKGGCGHYMRSCAP